MPAAIWTVPPLGARLIAARSAAVSWVGVFVQRPPAALPPVVSMSDTGGCVRVSTTSVAVTPTQRAKYRAALGARRVAGGAGCGTFHGLFAGLVIATPCRPW